MIASVNDDGMCGQIGGGYTGWVLEGERMVDEERPGGL